MSLLDMLNPFQNRDYIELIKDFNEHQHKDIKTMRCKVPVVDNGGNVRKDEPKPEEGEVVKELEPKFDFEPDRIPLEEYKLLKRAQNPHFNPFDTSIVFRLTQKELESFLEFGSLILNIDCRNGHLEYERDEFNCPSDRINTIILLKENEDGE